MNGARAAMLAGLNAALCAAGCLDFEQYAFRSESGSGAQPGFTPGGASGANAAGSGSAGAAAEAGCQPDFCSGACLGNRCVECEPGTIDCENTTAYRQCSAEGTWSALRFCTNQLCTPAGCEGECEPRRTRCRGADVQTCGDDGIWGEPTPCSNGSWSCSGTSCPGECTGTETQCFDADELQTCESGQWQTSDCEEVCDPEAGRCAECLTGASRCDPGFARNIQICNEGLWASGPQCLFRCTDDVEESSASCTGECTPGHVRCDPSANDVRQVCNANYEYDDSTCPFVCTGQGVCGGECKPNNLQCSPADGERERCDGNGFWQRPDPCPPGESCYGYEMNVRCGVI